MVNAYSKGYRAERELALMLNSKGWAVMRAPRSGRMGIPLPDIVAIRNRRVLSFEVKSREIGFSIRKEQYEEMLEWKRRTGAEFYLAVKIPRKGWFAMPVESIPESLYIGKSCKFSELEKLIS